MNVDLIRAWKDEVYREGLTEEQRALLPANPAGAIELTEDELGAVDGAMLPTTTSLTSTLTTTITVSILLSCARYCL